MSTTTTPPPPTTSPTTTTSSSAVSPQTLTYLSWSALILCPILVLLPPRKLDIYTLGLLGTTFAGGNQISKEYTGISIAERMGGRMMQFGDSELPPKAKEMQRRLREEKAARETATLFESASSKGNGEKEGGGLGLGEVKRNVGKDDGMGLVMSELDAHKRAKEEEERIAHEKGLLEKIWMGSEGEDWKAKRDKREKEALEEGKGYGGLIMDQIWEVWSWGRDKNEEVKEIDKKIVAERKENVEEKKR